MLIGLAILVIFPKSFAQSLVQSSTGVSALIIATSVLGTIFLASIAYGVYRTFRGESAGIIESVWKSMLHFMPLCITAIIIFFCSKIGLMLLLLPGIFMLCAWTVAIPACVVERLGAIDSIKRSAELTYGHRWVIFGLLALVFSGAIILRLVLGFVLPAFVQSTLAIVFISEVAAILPVALQSVMQAIIYYDLRAIEEGVAVGNLANVFD